MNRKEAEQFVADSEWVYAKSYSSTFPHEYTTRDRVKDDQRFDDFIRYIRDNAILKSFFNKVYLYCEIGEWEYWEMGRPIKTVVVINRAKIDDTKDYRKKAVADSKGIILDRMDKREKRLEYLESLEHLTQEEAEELRKLLEYNDNIIDTI